MRSIFASEEKYQLEIQGIEQDRRTCVIGCHRQGFRGLLERVAEPVADPRSFFELIVGDRSGRRLLGTLEQSSASIVSFELLFFEDIFCNECQATI